MAYSFFYGIYIFSLTLLAGMLSCTYLSKAWDDPKPCAPKISLTTLLILGIISLSVTGAIISLFHPLNSVVHLFISILLIAAALFNWESITSQLRYWFNAASKQYSYLFLIAYVYILSIYRASNFVTLPDTGYYHLSLVKWLNEYGLVKGLANLQDTFGFMSGWFYYVSFFDFGIFTDSSFHIINVIAYTLGWVFVFEMLSKINVKKPDSREIKNFLFIPLAIYLITSTQFIASLSVNILLNILIFKVFYLALKVEENPSTTFSTSMIVLFSAFGIFLKLSAFPVILLTLVPIYQLFVENTRIRYLQKFVRIAAPSLLILALFLIQNIILTGYPVYPIVSIDIMNVDWKVPAEDVNILARYIREYGSPLFQFNINPEDVSFFTWLYNWYLRNLFSPEYGMALNFLAFMPFAVAVNLLLMKGYRKITTLRDHLLLHWIAIVAIGLLFIASPNLRFAISWVLLGALFPILVYLHIHTKSLQNIRKHVVPLSIVCLISWMIFFARPSDTVYFSRDGTTSPFFFTLTEPSTPSYHKVQIADNTTVNVPLNKVYPRILDIPLPATGQEIKYRKGIDTAIVRRGKNLSSGFRPVSN